jgi:hypothetical protein
MRAARLELKLTSNGLRELLKSGLTNMRRADDEMTEMIGPVGKVKEAMPEAAEELVNFLSTSTYTF